MPQKQGGNKRPLGEIATDLEGRMSQEATPRKQGRGVKASTESVDTRTLPDNLSVKRFGAGPLRQQVRLLPEIFDGGSPLFFEFISFSFAFLASLPASARPAFARPPARSHIDVR